MGQIFSKQKDKQYDPELMLDLKNITITQLFDSVDTIDQYYPSQHSLTFEQFDDIFSTLTTKYIDVFERIADVDDYNSKFVNTFEALACFAIFGGESYETKCSFIFRLFDFDVSNTLERNEMLKTIQCVVRVMCKLVGLMIPSRPMLQKLSEVCFQMMDVDRNRRVDYSEFYNWTIDNNELQEFLLHYSHTQTYGYAKKRMQEISLITEDNFKAIGQKYLESHNYVPALRLKQHLPEMFSNIDQQYIDQLFKVIIDYSLRMKTLGQDDASKNQQNLWEWRTDPSKWNKILESLFVKRLDFMDIMKAWNTYSVVDINNQSNISTKDLKMMLWIYEDEEPDYFRVNSEMAAIDADKSKTINRGEWLIYLCSEDQLSKQQVYNSLLKKMFDKYDEDQDGIISDKFIEKLLRDIFKEQLKKLKDLKSAESFLKIIDSLVLQLMDELSKDNLNEFNWIQFHTFLTQSTQKYENLSKLLNIGNN